MCIVNTEKKIETWIDMKSATNTNKAKNNKKNTETVHSTQYTGMGSREWEKKKELWIVNIIYTINDICELRRRKKNWLFTRFANRHALNVLRCMLKNHTICWEFKSCLLHTVHSAHNIAVKQYNSTTVIVLHMLSISKLKLKPNDAFKIQIEINGIDVRQFTFCHIIRCRLSTHRHTYTPCLCALNSLLFFLHISLFLLTSENGSQNSKIH